MVSCIVFMGLLRVLAINDGSPDDKALHAVPVISGRLSVSSIVTSWVSTPEK